METKHTPGPWDAIPDCPEEGSGDWYVVADNEDVLARGSSEPDARLIAAAPDLLAALQWLAHEASCSDPSNSLLLGDALDKARAAIAKAEGAL